MKRVVFLVCFLFTAVSFGGDSAYEIESIPTPEGVDPQVGGIDVLPDGRVFACFHRGEVGLYDPETGEWTLFARGLHEPLGLVAESESSIVVMQRPELTRISDTDGDGTADRYETVTDDFGMTGNYHEFAFGPIRDEEGNLYFSLNVASNGASIREEVRGEFLDLGLPRPEFYRPWNEVKGKAGRMYSRVPWRGWVMKYETNSGTLIPWASGFRSPDGLGFDADGNLFVSDNQGDWLGTSKLHHVKKGRFHGHPASLPWRSDWDGTPPLEVPVERLEELRTPAAVWFTQGTMSNSPTQPVLIPEGFGPFAGQMLIGEMNRPRIIRLMLEEVNGVMQGACIPFHDGSPLPSGVHRLAFGPDQSLWTGHTHLSWAGGKGMTRIQYEESALPFEILRLSLVKGGFEVEFTEPITKLPSPELICYTFAYHSKYGSPQLEEEKLEVSVEKIDDRRARLLLPGPAKKDFCYEFRFETVRGPGDEALGNSLVCYTVREKRE